MDGRTPVNGASWKAVKRAIVAAAALVATACAAPAQAEALAADSAAREEMAEGMAAVLGFVGYQWLRLDKLNEQLQAQGFQLGSGGYVPGFGVMGAIGGRWGFSTAGSELSVQGASPDGQEKFSRLTINTTEIGVNYRLWARPALRLLAGGSVGLATVTLEWADWSSLQPEPEDVKSILDQKGGRLTRQLLTLQPQIDLQWALATTAGLQLSLGYMVGTDFWNPRWAHPARRVFVEGIPRLFTGPVVRLSILVGSL